MNELYKWSLIYEVYQAGICLKEVFSFLIAFTLCTVERGI